MSNYDIDKQAVDQLGGTGSAPEAGMDEVALMSTGGMVMGLLAIVGAGLVLAAVLAEHGLGTVARVGVICLGGTLLAFSGFRLALLFSAVVRGGARLVSANDATE